MRLIKSFDMKQLELNYSIIINYEAIICYFLKAAFFLVD
jgi:hypothetical protein